MSFVAAQVARQLGAAGRIAEDQGRATTIQYPSTAAFMIDSVDRDQDVYPSSASFTINKNQNLFTGFISRISLQEIVLDWGIPNVFDNAIGDTASFTVEVVITTPPSTTYTVVLPTGFYNAKQVLDALVAALNTVIGTPGLFVITGPTTTDPRIFMDITGVGNTFEIMDTDLAYEIFTEKQVGSGQNASYQVVCPRILPYRYLDFVCTDLTYNQDLKDNDTSKNAKDVIYRWYLAWDTPVAVDAYGFPIYQGYTPFIQRRIIPFPKQILWNRDQPIGQVKWEVYDESDRLVDPLEFDAAEMEFQMTLLLSEN